MNRNVWRVGGIALMSGLALFLITLLVKLALVVLATGVILRVVGGKLMGRFAGPAGRVGGLSTDIISIDNSAYRTPVNRAGFDRVAFDRIIPIG